MSGQPVLATRYSFTLDGPLYFPVGDEDYALGLELEDGEAVLASGIYVNAAWDVDPPTWDAETLTVTGADDGDPAEGSEVTAWALVAEPGYAVDMPLPEVPT